MKLDTEALKHHMGVRFMSPTDLAEQIGVSTQTVRMYAWGKTQPKPENLRKMCEVLECSPEELVREW